MTVDQLRGVCQDYPAKCLDGEGGLPCLDVHTDLADARIYLHGAHVTHFQPRGHKPVLFMSTKSYFTAGKPIRGGVPVCWPWFGPKADDANAPGHGFARLQEWEVTSVSNAADEIQITLQLAPSGLSRAYGYDHFLLEFRLTVGQELSMALNVRNTGTSPLPMQEALHTYFAVGDVHHATVTGLAGVTYMDKTRAMQRYTQEGAIAFTGETDRHFINTNSQTAINDSSMARRIIIGKTGSRTTVVWTPWIAKAKSMADFGDDEWPGMVCVETANAADNAITLAPHHSHEMRAIIRVEHL